MVIWLIAGIICLAAGSAWADKLICVTDEKLRGQMDVNTCLKKGEKFAILDEHGAPRILSHEEVKLMQTLNPKAFEQPAYGVMYQHEAPEIPKLPTLAVPKRIQ